MHPSAHTLALTHAQPHARITLHTVTPTLRLHVPAFTHTCPHTHRHTSRSHRARMHVRIITYVQPCAVSCQANTNATHPGQQSSHVCICVNTHRSPLMRSCLSTRVTYIHAVVRAHIHAPVRMYKGRLSVTRFLSSVCLSEHPHPHLAHPNTHTHTAVLRAISSPPLPRSHWLDVCPSELGEGTWWGRNGIGRAIPSLRFGAVLTPSGAVVKCPISPRAHRRLPQADLRIPK